MESTMSNNITNPVGRPANWQLRERIFRCVAAGGAVKFRTSSRIRSRLGKNGTPPSAVTVNNHLRNLASQGFISIVGEENSAGRGRPAKVYALTPLGAVAASFRK